MHHDMYRDPLGWKSCWLIAVIFFIMFSGFGYLIYSTENRLDEYKKPKFESEFHTGQMVESVVSNQKGQVIGSSWWRDKWSYCVRFGFHHTGDASNLLGSGGDHYQKPLTTVCNMSAYELRKVE